MVNNRHVLGRCLAELAEDRRLARWQGAGGRQEGCGIRQRRAVPLTDFWQAWHGWNTSYGIGTVLLMEYVAGSTGCQVGCIIMVSGGKLS